MALVKDEIIVIRSTDYSEADKILTVYGRNRGKYSLIAKGVRKIESKNRGAVQTLSRSAITYYEGRNLGVLVEASLIHTPELDGEQLKIVSKLLLIYGKIIPEDESDAKLYEWLAGFLADTPTLREANKLRFKILRHLGYLPDMKVCGVCDKKGDLTHLNTSNMEMVCENCATELSLTGNLAIIGEIKYESSKMDEALDRYLLGIIEG